jgi:predicted nucleotidyltransferase
MAVTIGDIEKGVEVLRQFGARRILLFGRSVERPEAARDLDLACEGIPAEQFYRAAGRLMRMLEVPVDLVDLSQDTPFTRLVRQEGRIIYES